MGVKLNRSACEYAKQLIEAGKFIDDEREAWAEHHPSTQIEERFVEKNSFSEYNKWFMAINNEYGEDRTRHYEFRLFAVQSGWQFVPGRNP
jgi:hypothetical protein